MLDYTLLNESELIELLQNGDKLAEEELYNRNRKFISFVLKSFKVLPKDREEIFNVASTGFIKAVRKFDLSRNLKLSTFCYPYILGEVSKFYRDEYDTFAFRLSRPDYDNVKLIKKTIRNFVKEHGREPLDDEISAITNIPIEEIKFLSCISGSFSSIDREILDKDEKADTNVLKDRISVNSFENDTCELLDLYNAIQKLSTREQIIIKKHYFEDKTHLQIAKELGTSQSCVTRTLKRIYPKLKEIMEGNND